MAKAPPDPGGTAAYAPLGDSALLLTLGSAIDPGVNDRIHLLARAVARAALPGISGVVPSYASLAVHFEPRVWDHARLERALREVEAGATEAAPPRTIVLPVRYGGDEGPDLEAVAGHCGLGPAEVVARHCAGVYRVHFLGFAPGFPYLGGLDPALATPRRAVPRTRVPAGSVGIAGPQTGIYPLETPGGWQIIGRTPLVLFDPLREEPCLLRAGDLLRFEAAP
jgi:KipI family sensor histidine kinase inhibitor